jgi:hypothetical protein
MNTFAYIVKFYFTLILAFPREVDRRALSIGSCQVKIWKAGTGQKPPDKKTLLIEINQVKLIRNRFY